MTMPNGAAWPFGDEEMAGRIRAHHWGATGLGPVEAWPERLRAAVDMVLAMPGPATILWGPAGVQLYNDAYIAITKDRHPTLLGRPVAEGWADAYDAVIAPLLDAARAGRATRLADIPVALRGPDGTVEERRFDTAWSPIRDEQGTVAGVLQTLAEVTGRRRAEAALQDSEARLREAEARQAFLLRFSDALRPIEDPVEIQRTATQMLGEHLRASRVFYVVINEDGDTADIFGSYADGVSSRVGRYSLSAFSSYAVGEWRAGRTASTGDVNIDPRYNEAEREAYASVSTRAGFGVPLIKEGRLVALLGVNQSSPRQWTHHDIELTSDVAERTWAAVERARAEVVLRKSEARLAAVFEVLPVGVGVFDAHGALLLSNQEMRRFMPTSVLPSRDEARRSRWRASHPDGRPVEPQDFPGACALRGERVVPGIEMLHTDDDGREAWTSISSVPLKDGEDRVAGAAVVVAGIDALKRGAEALRESEERLRQFGEASQDILWIRDAETLQWTYLTPAFETLYGLSREEVLTGDNYRGWQDLIVPEDRAHAAASVGRVAAGERVTFEYRIRRPVDGQVRWPATRTSRCPTRRAGWCALAASGTTSPR